MSSCVAQSFSWIHLENGWKYAKGELNYVVETKRFIAVLVDNVRRKTNIRKVNLGNQQGWLSIYIRDQEM